MKNIRLYAITFFIFVGLGLSVYLTLIHFGCLGEQGTYCSVDGSCKAVASFPSLNIFGVPASVAGVVYFGFLSFAVASRCAFGRWILYWFLFAVFIVGLAVSIALTYIMYTRLAVCPYCIAAHVCNLSAFVLYLFEPRN